MAPVRQASQQLPSTGKTRPPLSGAPPPSPLGMSLSTYNQTLMQCTPSPGRPDFASTPICWRHSINNDRTKCWRFKSYYGRVFRHGSELCEWNASPSERVPELLKWISDACNYPCRRWRPIPDNSNLKPSQRGKCKHHQQADNLHQ
jgi:hypothetical protein